MSDVSAIHLSSGVLSVQLVLFIVFLYFFEMKARKESFKS